jgi:predicted transposase YbfD/YdcC
MTGFIEQFKDIPDPRVDRTKKHKLIDILFITLSAILCGCDEWEEIQSYGEKKETWLRKYLELPNGIPSHDTFNRTISLLDPQVLQQRFVSWVQSLVELHPGDIVNIDGKRLCNSGKDSKDAIVHMVSAWSDANNMVLGSCKVSDKSNEITAIPQLLELLDLSECTITIDAMGCQKEIASTIVDKGAHYLLAVKENQPRLLDDLREAFKHHPPQDIDTDRQTELAHGRIEERSCRVITDMDWICNADQWKGIRSIIEITGERTDKKSGQYQKQVRYYISDLQQDAKDFNRLVRTHWSIENSQHWVLDVAFNEDASRKRAKNAAENFAILNRMALNIVKADTATKASMKRKRKMAGWDDQYLEHLLINIKN